MMTDSHHKPDHMEDLKNLLIDLDLGKPFNVYGRVWLKICIGTLFNQGKEEELMEVLRVWTTGE